MQQYVKMPMRALRCLPFLNGLGGILRFAGLRIDFENQFRVIGVI